MANRHSSSSSTKQSDEGYSCSGISGSGEVDVPEDSCFGTTKHKDRSNRHDIQDHRLGEKLTEADINDISTDLGASWSELARVLGFPEVKVQEFKQQCNDKERAHAMLIAFMRREGRHATKNRLADALAKKTVGRKDIAEKLVGEEELPAVKWFLKPVGYFTPEGSQVQYIVCREIRSGKLYLLRSLKGTSYERACKTLIEEDGQAESHLRALDPIALVDDEKAKQELEIKKRLYEEAREHFNKLRQNFQQIQDELKNQEKREEHVNVGEELKKCQQMTKDLQANCSGLFRISWTVYKHDDTFTIKSQLVDHVTDMSTCQRDLEERIQMLLEMASSDPDLTDEIKSGEKIKKQCHNLGKEIKMRQKTFDQLLQQEFSGTERTQSTPTSQNPRPWLPRRSSTQPLSLSQYRALTEQIRPKDED